MHAPGGSLVSWILGRTRSGRSGCTASGSWIATAGLSIRTDVSRMTVRDRFRMSGVQTQQPLAERLTWSRLDLLVLLVECAGSAGAAWLTLHWSHLACQPDGDGLEFLGVFLGVGLFGLLLPAFGCTLSGLVSRRRGPLVTGRVLVSLCVLGWPPIPPMLVGFGVLSVVPWNC